MQHFGETAYIMKALRKGTSTGDSKALAKSKANAATMRQMLAGIWGITVVFSRPMHEAISSQKRA
jgi:hypothetical protein